MTQIIAICGQKGGAGKSTMARTLAIGFARKRFKVKLIDMDMKQGTSVEWSKVREKNSPNLITAEVELGSDHKKVIRENTDLDYLVFDTHGHVDGDILDLALKATVILIPSQGTRDDLLPQVRFARELTEKRVPKGNIYFCLTRILSHAQFSSANDTLDSLEWEVIGSLPNKVSISGWQDKGRTAAETPFKNINIYSVRLIDKVLSILNSKS